MRMDRFTIKAQEAIGDAQKIAEAHNHQQIDTEHLLLALVHQGDGLIPPLLSKLGANPKILADQIEKHLTRLPQVTVQGDGGQLFITPRLKKILDTAQEESDRLKDDYVSTEHLLIAMVSSDGAASGFLKGAGVNKDALFAALAEVRGTQRVTDPAPEEKYQALVKYSRDLTELARKGKLDPVIGRDEEIRRVIQVLSRRTKNNPVLIGEPGVGKTAIAE